MQTRVRLIICAPAKALQNLKGWRRTITSGASKGNSGPLLLVCIVLCGFMTAGSLLAHHSLAGVYDMKKDMEMSGAVESIKFVNPHGSLTIAVKNPDGSTTSWVMTLGSATSLAQRGVGKTGENALHTG